MASSFLTYEGKLINFGDQSSSIVAFNRVPYEYQEVEWIGFNDNAWIQTGIQTYGRVFVSTCCKKSGTSTYSFGTGPNPRIACTFEGAVVTIYNDNNATPGIFRFSWSSGQYANIELYRTPYINETYWVSVDGSKIERTQTSTMPSTIGKMYVGAWLYNSTTIRHFCGEMKYFQMSIENVEVINLIPCYRKADNVIGMYDLVSKTFFTNSGTGSFTKGADVN